MVLAVWLTPPMDICCGNRTMAVQCLLRCTTEPLTPACDKAYHATHGRTPHSDGARES
jgi:hypothetical protein